MKFALTLFLFTLPAWGATSVELAQKLIASLDPEQTKQTVFAADDPSRQAWNFTPGERKGLTIKAMQPQQRQDAADLLKSVMSEIGYFKFMGVLRREDKLAELEKAPDYRDVEKYYFAIFGKPANGSRWGFRMEGHHLSLNFTLLGDLLLHATPHFIGANPIFLRNYRLWGEEMDLAHELVRSLPAKDPCKQPWTKKQNTLALKIASGWIDDIQKDFADKVKKKLAKEPFCLKWKGDKEGKAGYEFTLSTPSLSIEVDASQNNGQHLHTVWKTISDN